jgi:hypothetical protein
MYVIQEQTSDQKLGPWKFELHRLWGRFLIYPPGEKCDPKGEVVPQGWICTPGAKLYHPRGEIVPKRWTLNPRVEVGEDPLFAPPFFLTVESVHPRRG